MHDEILNITNGDYFNEYFIATFGGTAVPFCEDMMDGDLVTDIFSEKFVKLRAKALNVSENEYRAKMYVYHVLSQKKYPTICLWFGKDTFCQMNLLALLAYLEQIGYCGTLILNYINDDTFEIIESDIHVELGIYGAIYQEVLIAKRIPDNLGVLNARTIDLYFDYHSDDGRLANLVKMNGDKDKTELICLLLHASKDYGLSDLQAEMLINAHLPMRR